MRVPQLSKMAESRKRGRPSKKSTSNSPSIDSAQDETLGKEKGKGVLLYPSDISSSLPSKASLNPSPLQVIRATLEKGKSVSPVKSAKRTKKLNVFELVSDDDESPLATTSPKDTKVKRGKSKVVPSPIRGKTSSKNTKASGKSPKSSPLKKSEDKSEKQSKGKKTAPSPRKPSSKSEYFEACLLSLLFCGSNLHQNLKYFLMVWKIYVWRYVCSLTLPDPAAILMPIPMKWLIEFWLR